MTIIQQQQHTQTHAEFGSYIGSNTILLFEFDNYIIPLIFVVEILINMNFCFEISQENLPPSYLSFFRRSQSVSRLQIDSTTTNFDPYECLPPVCFLNVDKRSCIIR